MYQNIRAAAPIITAKTFCLSQFTIEISSFYSVSAAFLFNVYPENATSYAIFYTCITEKILNIAGPGNELLPAALSI